MVCEEYGKGILSLQCHCTMVLLILRLLYHEVVNSKFIIIYVTRSGARFARPFLVYEFRDCCSTGWRAGRI